MDKVNNLNENKKEVKNTKKEAPARPFMTPPAGKPLPKHMVQAPNGKMIPQGSRFSTDLEISFLSNVLPSKSTQIYIDIFSYRL